ncbi:HEAT repeat-containing protein 1 [Branchiostoma belcheri]|nr:HEAT repeat-containing protein 1 [Branchiostoma belcheri]
MTSLATQLQRLALPQSELAVPDKDRERASLLFDPKEAANLDRDTFYALGVNGLDELANIDPVFLDFHNNLFSQSSKNLERVVQTKEVNARLDENISRFLTLVSPYFLLRPAQKALEWLINRFHIHRFNTDDLVACVLPYHQTKMFVRVVQLLKIEQPTNRWNWMAAIQCGIVWCSGTSLDYHTGRPGFDSGLYPNKSEHAPRRCTLGKGTLHDFPHFTQKPGTPLARSTVINHCAADLGFLTFICDMVQKATNCKLHSSQDSSAPSPMRALVSFYATTILGALEVTETIKENLVTKLLPYVLKGLKSRAILDYKAASYLIIGQLANKITMQGLLVQTFVKGICKHISPQLSLEAVTCLAVLCHKQRVDKLPKRSFKLLCRVPGLVQTLARLTTAHDITGLLTVFLPQLVKAAVNDTVSTTTGTSSEGEDSTTGPVSYCGLLENLLLDVQLPESLQTLVAKTLFQDYLTVRSQMTGKSPSAVQSLNERAGPIVKLIDRRYPVAMDTILQIHMGQSAEEVSEVSHDAEHVQEFVSLSLGGLKHQLVPEAQTSLVLSLNHPNATVRRNAVKHLPKAWQSQQNGTFHLPLAMEHMFHCGLPGVTLHDLPTLPKEGLEDTLIPLLHRSGVSESAADVLTSEVLLRDNPTVHDNVVVAVLPLMFVVVPDAKSAEVTTAAMLARSYLCQEHQLLKGAQQAWSHLSQSSDVNVVMATANQGLVSHLSGNLAAMEPDMRESMIQKLYEAATSPAEGCGNLPMVVSFILAHLIGQLDPGDQGALCQQALDLVCNRLHQVGSSEDGKPLRRVKGALDLQNLKFLHTKVAIMPQNLTIHYQKMSHQGFGPDSPQFVPVLLWLLNNIIVNLHVPADLTSPMTVLFVYGVQHQGQFFSTKDRSVCGWCSAPKTGLFVDGVQHQGQFFSTKDRSVCGWCSAPRTAPRTGLFVDGVQHQGQVCLWMVFTTKDRSVCGWCSAPRTGLFVDGVQHQGQACLWMVFSTKDRPVCGWCSAPGQACLWMVFTTKDRSVCGWCSAPRTGLFVDGVQHRGQACLWMVFSTRTGLFVDGVQHQGQVCLWMVFSTKDRPVCGWCSAPRTGLFVDGVQHQGQACLWMVFSTKDRPVCGWRSAPRTGLFVDGVQHQGQVCLWMVFSTKDRSVCGWCSAPRTGLFVDGVQHQGQACLWMVFSTKDRSVCGWRSAPRTAKQWWSQQTADPSQKSYLSLLVQLFDLLVTFTSGAKADHHVQHFRQLMQNFLKVHLPDTGSLFRFLSMLWVCHHDDSHTRALVQVRALHMAAVCINSSGDKAVSKLMGKESSVLPSLLVTLQHRVPAVREAAVAVLEALLKQSDGSMYGEVLVKKLVHAREELVADNNHLKQPLEQPKLPVSKASPGKHKQKAEAKQAVLQATLDSLLGHVTAEDTPPHMKVGLLEALQLVNSQAVQVFFEGRFLRLDTLPNANPNPSRAQEPSN